MISKYIKVEVLAIPRENTSVIMDGGLRRGIREEIAISLIAIENAYPEYTFSMLATLEGEAR